MNTSFTDSVIVSYDYTSGEDRSVMLVGRKRPGQAVEVINAFLDEDAEELWKKLTSRKEKTE